MRSLKIFAVFLFEILGIDKRHLNHFRSQLPADPLPEILRCPLEHAVLRTKLLDLGEPKALLALVIDPPRWSSIVKTIATLKEVGALYTTAKGKLTIDDGDLTYLGRVICQLPIDVHLGKLIMLGTSRINQSLVSHESRRNIPS